MSCSFSTRGIDYDHETKILNVNIGSENYSCITRKKYESTPELIGHILKQYITQRKSVEDKIEKTKITLEKYEKRKEQQRIEYNENKEEYRALRYDRYHNDPEHRERVLAKTKRSQAKKRMLKKAAAEAEKLDTLNETETESNSSNTPEL